MKSKTRLTQAAQSKLSLVLVLVLLGLAALAWEWQAAHTKPRREHQTEFHHASLETPPTPP